MPTTALRVLVYGGTGSQSNPVVQKLLERGHQPLVLTRDLPKAAPLVATGAKLIEGDMADLASLQQASQGVDAIALLIPFFISKPFDAITFGRNAIDAAKAAGVKLIVWNTSGVTPPEKTGNPDIDVRIEITDYLSASGLKHIIIEPTVYAENLLGPWTAPNVAVKDQVSYPSPTETRLGWIASEDVGALMVAALERPELAGTTFQVSGLENVNGNELAERFSQALEREISYYAMEPEEFGAVLDTFFGPGAGASVVTEYRKMRENPNPPPMYFDMQPVLEKLPIEMTPLTKWVARHKALFTTALTTAQAMQRI